MANQSLVLTDFQAGIGTLGQKRDKPGSARFVKNLNPWEDLDYITLSRKTTKISSTTIANLPLWMEDGTPYDTNRYVYDQVGNIYEVDSNDVVTLLRDVSGNGEGFKIFDDYLYYAQDTELGRYGRLSGTSAFDDDLTSWWDAAISDIQSTGGGTGASDYVPPTSISEAATARQTWTATHDPLKEITINIDVVGTGDWTVTIHDTEDNVIGTRTHLNGNVTTGDFTFTFATALSLIIGNEYHFHITSTVADGGVDTDTATDLEGADFIIEYGVLISASWHAMVVIEDLLVIGNDRYLATFNQASYDPNTIAFDPGFTCRNLIKTEEYIIAECSKGLNIATDVEEVKRYYWDGIQPSFNFSEPVAIGRAGAITFSKADKVIGVYGHRGTLYEAKTERELTHEVPKLAQGTYINTYPQAITTNENKILIGYAVGYDDTDGLEIGVYEFGSQTMETPVGITLSYTLSTGNTQGTNLQVSLVKAIAGNIYIGWRDDTNYGIDKVDRDADAATSGIWESLIFDNGNSKKDKLALQLKATFVGLASGESVTLAYQIDRSGSFTAGSAINTVGETEAELDIYSRFKEIELKFTLASSSGTFPKLTSLIFNFDPLDQEKVE